MINSDMVFLILFVWALVAFYYFSVFEIKYCSLSEDKGIIIWCVVFAVVMIALDNMVIYDVLHKI